MAGSGADQALAGPSEPPASPVTGPKWRALLEASADDWHALYHLGLVRLADDDRDGAREAWTRSLAERPNAWAQRALAHLAGVSRRARQI